MQKTEENGIRARVDRKAGQVRDKISVHAYSSSKVLNKISERKKMKGREGRKK
jgi:cobalamin biosynthesis Co2+ chelatase CbiK